jgi:transcriptional regulator with XRE-family HTH domain
MTPQNPCLIKPGLIAELRLQKGWSQKDLVRETKLSRRTIASLESGRGRFAALTVREVARALGVSADSLILSEEKSKVTRAELSTQFDSANDPVILALVIRGSRAQINEMWPMRDLGQIISRMIDEGKIIPLDLREGSIVLKAQMHSFVAVELISRFATETTPRSKLYRVLIPMTYSFLAPSTQDEVPLAASQLPGKAGFGFVVPYRVQSQLSSIAEAIQANRLRRQILANGDVALSHSQMQASVNEALTPM